MKVASNVNDGEIKRNFDEVDNSNVANRVRSASESSGLRHLFSNKKKDLEADGKLSRFTKLICNSTHNDIGSKND